MALFLFLFALFLRLPSILRGDFAFTFDTGRDLLAVRDLLGGNISLIGQTTGIIGVFYGPWWYWFLAPWFLVFGGSPVALTAVIALMGSLAAVVAYLWGAKFGKRRFGVILGLILAASPGFVKVTNQLWNPDLLIPTTLATVILLSSLRGTLRVYILLGFLLVLLAEFQIVFGVLFGIGFVIASFLWLRSEFSASKVRNVVLGAIIVELPRILFELRHGFIQTKTFLGELGTSMFAFQPKRDWLIYENLSSVFPGTPVVQNLLVFFSMCILFVYWKRMSEKLHRLILVSITMVAVFWITLFFYPKDFWNYYLLGLPVLYCIIVGALWSVIPQKFVTLRTIALVVYFFFLIEPSRIVSSITNSHFVGDAAVFRNQREILDFIRAENTETFKYIAYNPAQHDYNWQYLFWWYKNKGSLPMYTEDNPAMMFVILEPDDAYPDRLKEWLKIRERDGVVLREVTFPSGIKVQTRRLRWN